MPRFRIAEPGVWDDYEREKRPVGHGGSATVFRAVHKPSGICVAVKRLNVDADNPDAADRMRHEVKALRQLAGNRHVMPILDADEHFKWYVMPLAKRDLSRLATPIDEREIAEIVLAVAAGLAPAHAARYVHRDVKPQNILLLDADECFPERWVVADWGLVRNPRGLTTSLRTPTKQVIGTDGFVAPEVLRGSHKNSSPKSDVYSLGRVLLWARTGEYPLAGSQELPEGAFRRIAKRVTADNPQARLSLPEFVAAVEALDFEPPSLPIEATLDRANAGDTEAAEQLFDSAAENPTDSDFFLDFLAKLGPEAKLKAVLDDPKRASRLVEMMGEHICQNWGWRSYAYADVPLTWMLDIARAAGAQGDMGLLEDAAEAYFEADPAANQYSQRRRSQGWLNTLRGAQAQTVARALRSNARAVDWYTDEGWQPDSRADRNIRAALARH
jgi:serine/threonine protein kinase